MKSSTDQSGLVVRPVAVAAAAEDVLLTAEDRCDRCCAPAKVRVCPTAGELLSCGHHSAQHAAALVSALR